MHYSETEEGILSLAIGVNQGGFSDYIGIAFIPKLDFFLYDADELEFYSISGDEKGIKVGQICNFLIELGKSNGIDYSSLIEKLIDIERNDLN